MLKRLFIVTALLMTLFSLRALTDHDKIVTICNDLVKQMDLDQPIFLDIRAGEWSLQLENEIRMELLKNNADVRELLPEYRSPVSETESGDVDLPKISLDNYLTESAYLYQISLDIAWQVIENNRIFAYRVERLPKYSFTLKKIHLPESRLVALNTISYNGSAPEALNSRELRLKWFDPIVASLAIGSLIYLLWTIE